jgi:hypothetical protein
VEPQARVLALQSALPYRGAVVRPGGVDDDHLVLSRWQRLIDQWRKTAVEVRRMIVGCNEKSANEA